MLASLGNLEARTPGSLCQRVYFLLGAGDTDYRYKFSIADCAFTVSVEARNPIAAEDRIRQRFLSGYLSGLHKGASNQSHLM